MPLTSFLAAPGSLIRLCSCTIRLIRPAPLITSFLQQSCLTPGTRRPFSHYYGPYAPESLSEPWVYREAQPSVRRRKRERLSRPTEVLESIQTSARSMYLIPIDGKVKSSSGGDPTTSLIEPARSLSKQPVSLYSTIARYLHHHTGPNLQGAGFNFTLYEEDVLRGKGFTSTSVEKWATSLLERKSLAAVGILAPDADPPPLFMLLLLLRRRYLSAFALGVIMRHIDERVKSEPLTWTCLKILSIRLLRHARVLWPESIPWIAALFAAQASILFGETMSAAPPKSLSDITRFCNTFLYLLSLPSSINPVLGALNQEKAQFQVLRFMASQTPSITVTRLGFRSVSRVQLAHTKTAEERDWAELKGPSWPPWKENRTAMDEDKGFAFGASRASKILHRMYEAGYRGHTWEEMVEIYAGWDTDFSPTIQTRTSLPHVSSHFENRKYLTSLLWAGRVATTRTRREAWACFLAYEASGAPASQHVYLAMFEKLHYPESKRSSKQRYQLDLGKFFKPDLDSDNQEIDLLPGDMKEVLPDHTSSLHHVYLSEPIPTIKGLRRRMHKQNIRPSNRLLAFLSHATGTFETCIDVFETAKEDFNGGIGCLLYGQHNHESPISQVPDYLLAAFIKCLCRYGQFAHTPQESATLLSPEDHALLFKYNRNYLLEYAYALLMRYRPMYRPAWTAYIEKVVRSNLGAPRFNHQWHTTRGDGFVQYAVVWKLIKSMEQIDLHVDDHIFNLVCIATTSAAQAARKRYTSVGDAQQILTTASSRLRKLFHSLVGANIDIQSASAFTSRERSSTIPPHIPGPAELHAYVRALGSLHDYEGLYSFSTWLTMYHTEVTARSDAQHSGNKILFRTLVALRAAVTGYLKDEYDPQRRAPDEIVQLIKHQIESIEEWGGWPTQRYVDLYSKGALKSELPSVGGR
ncbi:hypothetical protein GQ44DRAFT_704623 [Phaeosphaeriaceae sp. PMI808]|nr:hypothetical protein GQ44DRAFT_704623 [Phaeosphaeriaceae sp. PMI808]